MTAGTLLKEDNVIAFTAMMPVDGGAVDEQQFKDFFTAVCEEIDSF